MTTTKTYDQELKQALIEKYRLKKQKNFRKIANSDISTVDFSLKRLECLKTHFKGFKYEIVSLEPFKANLLTPSISKAGYAKVVVSASKDPKCKSMAMHAPYGFEILDFSKPQVVSFDKTLPLFFQRILNTKKDIGDIGYVNNLGSVYEAFRYFHSRQSKSFSFFINSPDEFTFWNFLNRFNGIDKLRNFEEPQLGDLLVISQGIIFSHPLANDFDRKQALHAGVFIDQDLFLEFQTLKGKTEWRLVTMPELQKRFGLDRPSDLEIHFFRANKKIILPEPHRVFSQSSPYKRVKSEPSRGLASEGVERFKVIRTKEELSGEYKETKIIPFRYD